MSEIKISDEARECAMQEIIAWNNGPSNEYAPGKCIQFLLNQRDAELAELQQAAKDFIWNVEHNLVAGWGDCSRDVRVDASFRELRNVAMTASQAGVKGGEKHE